MIQINNLVKKFDDFTALDGVNMNVEKGAVYGLVGPNGAGKVYTYQAYYRSNETGCRGSVY